MDDRLQKALDFSNYTLTLTNQKKNIRNRVTQLQLVHYNGGVFIANQETIAFVKAMLDMGHKSVTLIDVKENPVSVKDTQDLLEKLTSAYISSTNELEAEYQKIRKARNIHKIMDW